MTSDIGSVDVWYEVVSGPELKQGDIIVRCPVLTPTADVYTDPGGLKDVVIEYENAVVMSQSCDLAIRADGTCNLSQVLMCPIYSRSESVNHTELGRTDLWEEARKGRRPALHVLNEWTLGDAKMDFSIVNFGDPFMVEIEALRRIAEMSSPRLRLRSPYRERLSQAFGFFFMRVGYPQDIPRFR